MHILKTIRSSTSLPWLVSVVFAVILCLVYLDQIVVLYFAETRGSILVHFAKRTTRLAEADIYLISALLLMVYSRFKQQWNVYAKALLFFMTLVSTGLTINFFKFLFGRMRPFEKSGYRTQIFEPLSFHWDFHSFPSGHAQVAFSLFFFTTLWFPKWKWLVLTLAIWLSFTRIFTTAHFLSDILVGGFAGFLLSKFYFQTLSELAIFKPRTGNEMLDRRRKI